MRSLLLPLLFALAAGHPARAFAEAPRHGVGVVVTGDPTTQPQLTAQLEQWLRAQGHPLAPSPLPAEALSTLIDCLVIEDLGCARAVVDRAAEAPEVVFAKVEATTIADGRRDLDVRIHWFERGAAPVVAQRVCERCTADALRTTAAALMDDLAGRGRKRVGTVAITSTPQGARVTVDGTDAGPTPVTLVTRAGAHQIVVRHPGHREERRSVTVAQAATLTVDVPLAPAAPAPSRLPLYVMAGGGALLLGGIVAYATSQEDDGTRYEYRDTRALGVGLSLTGLAAIGAGAYLYLRTGREAAPRVVLAPGAAYVGWAGAF